MTHVKLNCWHNIEILVTYCVLYTILHIYIYKYMWNIINQ